MTDHDAHDTTEDDKILAEAQRLDDEARKRNEKAEHDAKVNRARRVFAEDEEGVDGTRAVRLAHPGEVTDASGNPDPFGDHVNRGTALAPEIVPVAGLAPAEARSLGLPTGQGGGSVRAAADSGPTAQGAPAPEETRDEPAAQGAPAKKAAK